MLNICCCLWGRWPAPGGWGPEYVRRLRDGVKRNLKTAHRFICFADDPAMVPDGIEARKLDAPSWRGCLPKLYIYAPQTGLRGRVALFDLDNVITGPIDEMASYDGPMAVRAWFHGYDNGKRVADGDMIAFEAGSETANMIWDAFAADPAKAEAETGGRERYFLRSVVKPDLWQDVIPGQIVSYKRHVRRGGLPDNARVVSFHGSPRPHEVCEPWLTSHWY